MSACDRHASFPDPGSLIADPVKRPSVLQAIVLDFDGVLADSEPLHLRAFQDVLADSGLDLPAEEYYVRYVGLSDPLVFTTFGLDRGRPFEPSVVSRLCAAKAERYQALLTGVAPVAPAVAARVRAWGARVPLGIASGARRVEIELVLKGAALDTWFAAVVAVEDCRETKPSPEPYCRALRALGVNRPARAVAIEDSLHGLQAARAAGLRTVALTTTRPDFAPGDADLVACDIPSLGLDDLERLVRAAPDGSSRRPGAAR